MRFIANLSIGRRLAAGFALMLALCVLMAVFGYVQIDSLATKSREMMHVPLAKERMITDWYRSIYSGIRLGPFFVKDAQSAANSSSISDLQKKIEALLSYKRVLNTVLKAQWHRHRWSSAQVVARASCRSRVGSPVVSVSRTILNMRLVG